jgi:hypothetical protein
MVTLAEAGVEVNYHIVAIVPKKTSTAQLAQFWLACLTENQEVAGSNPALGILL